MLHIYAQGVKVKDQIQVRIIYSVAKTMSKLSYSNWGSSHKNEPYFPVGISVPKELKCFGIGLTVAPSVLTYSIW